MAAAPVAISVDGVSSQGEWRTAPTAFEISGEPWYAGDQFKDEFKRSSKDARGHSGTLDDET